MEEDGAITVFLLLLFVVIFSYSAATFTLHPIVAFRLDQSRLKVGHPNLLPFHTCGKLLWLLGEFLDGRQSRMWRQPPFYSLLEYFSKDES